MMTDNVKAMEADVTNKELGGYLVRLPGGAVGWIGRYHFPWHKRYSHLVPYYSTDKEGVTIHLPVAMYKKNIRQKWVTTFIKVSPSKHVENAVLVSVQLRLWNHALSGYDVVSPDQLDASKLKPLIPRAILRELFELSMPENSVRTKDIMPFFYMIIGLLIDPDFDPKEAGL